MQSKPGNAFLDTWFKGVIKSNAKTEQMLTAYTALSKAAIPCLEHTASKDERDELNKSFKYAEQLQLNKEQFDTLIILAFAKAMINSEAMMDLFYEAAETRKKQGLEVPELTDSYIAQHMVDVAKNMIVDHLQAYQDAVENPTNDLQTLFYNTFQNQEHNRNDSDADHKPHRPNSR